MIRLSSVYPTVKNWMTRRLQRENTVRLASLTDLFDPVDVFLRRPGTSIDAPLLDSMPLWSALAPLKGATYAAPDVGVAGVRNGLFCPTNRVLLGPDRTIVAESLTPMPGPHLPSRTYVPFVDEAIFLDAVEPLPGLSTTFQFHRRNYYHTLVDALPRLYLLHQLDLAAFGDPVQLLCHNLSSVEREYLDVLRPDGTVIVPIQEGQIYQAERFLHLPFITHESAGYLPPDYLAFFRSRVLPRRPPKANRRVLVTRQTVGTRRIRNFDAVWALLEPMGFERCELETLSPKAQRELFYDAECVVATHGAGLTNLLFAGPKTRVVELFPHPFVLPNYYLLSRALVLDYQYLCGTEQDRYADHEVDVRALQRSLYKTLSLSRPTTVSQTPSRLGSLHDPLSFLRDEFPKQKTAYSKG